MTRIHTKEETNCEEILSNLVIFDNLTADNRGKNPRITIFLYKMKTADNQNRIHQDCK